MLTAERYHDISCGHRVFGHEGKCSNLHGHNYRITFVIEGEQDALGRVIDFSVIKSKLCEWLEKNYDHKFLIWEDDELCDALALLDPTIVITGFNPTAENIAKHLVHAVAPRELEGTGCKLIECKVEETRKCSATFKI